LFDQGTGIDQISGAEVDPANFPNDQTKGQVGVASQGRQEKVRCKLKLTQRKHYLAIMNHWPFFTISQKKCG
jgi:hypothetical protein